MIYPKQELSCSEIKVRRFYSKMPKPLYKTRFKFKTKVNRLRSKITTSINFDQKSNRIDPS